MVTPQGQPAIELVAQVAVVECVRERCAAWNALGGCCGFTQSAVSFHRQERLGVAVETAVDKLTGGEGG